MIDDYIIARAAQRMKQLREAGADIALAEGGTTNGHDQLVQLGGRGAVEVVARRDALLAVQLVRQLQRLGDGATMDRRGSTGGYQLVAESVQPLMHDPSTATGRAALNLDAGADGLDGPHGRHRPRQHGEIQRQRCH